MTALWLVIKASALFGAAALGHAVLGRRASAAGRHLIWVAALGSVLLLPVVPRVLPAWNVPTLALSSDPPAPAAPRAPGSDLDSPVPAASEDRDPTPTSDAARSIRLMPDATKGSAAASGFSRTVSWTIAIAAIYAAGLLAMLLRLTMGELRLRRFARRAAVVRDGEWVGLVADAARRMEVVRAPRLLISREQTMPVAVGTRRPAIVLPAVANLWDDDRRRAVVSHELAHVARYDCLTERIAAIACAVYWFHPAAWWIARRLRIERELACDDRVIAAGADARAYAGHLLDLAYSFSRHRAPALSVAMAGRGQLEGRLIAALDETRNRAVPRRTFRLAGLAAAVAIVCAVAAARPTANAPESPVAGADQESERPVLPRQLRAGRLSDVANDAVRRFVRSVSFAVGFSQGIPGTWEVRRTETNGVVHLRIVEINSSNSTNMPIDRLEGLTDAQLTGAGGPVQFRLRRDAGTFTFEGVVRSGVGAGTFSFQADPGFPGELAKRGFARPTASEQYQLARHDVGFAFVDELNAQGYAKPTTADLVKAGQHGVQGTYLHDMGQLGYRLRSLDDLIALRDHGVTPQYVQELAALGYRSLSADEVLRARDHGVTPDYVRRIREAGYGSLSMDDLVRIRDHGITPEYVRELRDAGYGALPLEALVNTRDHGVGPEYVRGLAEAGFRNLPLDKLISARDHGVSAEYARDMRALGHAAGGIDALVNARDHGVSAEFARDMAAAGYTLALDDLIRLRDHGVTPEYARDVKALGYERLGPDDLVTLRDHGLTIDRIRSANARAGTRLPLDMLKLLADGGYR